ncbi:MAG: succinate dehydrogenase, hydrophobic membrane anchor protein [Lautropia sp.]
MERLLGGLRAWTLQRLSALYLLVFLAVIAGRALIEPPLDHARWAQWWRPPWAMAAALLFFVALSAHAWVGARDVLLDYVKPRWLQAALLAAIAVTLALTVVRLAAALLRIAG